jgi:hypothetical protein
MMIAIEYEHSPLLLQSPGHLPISISGTEAALQRKEKVYEIE